MKIQVFKEWIDFLFYQLKMEIIKEVTSEIIFQPYIYNITMF